MLIVTNRYCIGALFGLGLAVLTFAFIVCLFFKLFFFFFISCFEYIKMDGVVVQGHEEEPETGRAGNSQQGLQEQPARDVGGGKPSLLGEFEVIQHRDMPQDDGENDENVDGNGNRSGDTASGSGSGRSKRTLGNGNVQNQSNDTDDPGKTEPKNGRRIDEDGVQRP